RYTWKVRALPTGPYSNVEEFVLERPKYIPADKPELISPIGVVDVVPGFVWKTVTHATKYKVWIQDRSTGTSYAYEVDDNSMSPPPYVVAGKRFYWKVTGGSEDGWGPESDTVEFVFNKDNSYRIPPQCSSDDRYPQAPEVVVSRWTGEESSTESIDSNYKAGALNDDGRYFVFSSAEKALVENDSNDEKDIFVLDREQRSIQRVSQTLEGIGGDQASEDPAMSGNGRFVVFTSKASNLSELAFNGKNQVYLWDRETKELDLISLHSDGALANDDCAKPQISNDGRWVVYNSKASNLVDNDTNGNADTFLFDRESRTTTRVSIGVDGSEMSSGVLLHLAPAMTDDVSMIVFTSQEKPELAGPSTVETPRFIYARRLDLDATLNLCTNSAGQVINDGCDNAALSADGRYLAFRSQSQALASAGSSVPRVFRKDLLTKNVQLVSKSTSGIISDGASGEHISMSYDGRYVAFSSGDSRLTYGDLSDQRDMYQRDMQNGITILLGHKVQGRSANNQSINAVMSNNAQVMALLNVARKQTLDPETQDPADVVSWLIIGNPQLDQCGDQCPSDPSKTDMGACGCGIADENSNGNGAIDCLEGPLNTPTALRPEDLIPNNEDHNFVWEYSGSDAYFAITLTDLDTERSERLYARSGSTLALPESVNLQHSYQWKVRAFHGSLQ
ncbi:MAG: hypothetical protein KDD62_10500, partial [Bdellovibrionales bacterium]|nr:hypothetical protein [Bdellovibrionales bacterium]